MLPGVGISSWLPGSWSRRPILLPSVWIVECLSHPPGCVFLRQALHRQRQSAAAARCRAGAAPMRGRQRRGAEEVPAAASAYRQYRDVRVKYARNKTLRRRQPPANHGME